MKQFLSIGTPTAGQVWTWFKARTKGMLKVYFIFTFVGIIAANMSKAAVLETELMVALVIIGVIWGYTISITYWLIVQDVIPRPVSKGLHFLLWLITYNFGGIQLFGIFPSGSLLNLVLVDYWIILGLQHMVARKVEASEINASIQGLKMKWANDTAASRFNGYNG